jgi:hypothetical protein|tara:strand:- start:40 stop:432 length:393 start_codon:yes stop_codon:yes gene_type:complete
MKKNRLILIDPFEQTVSFVESDGTSDSITDLIKCDLIDVVDLSIANLSWLKRKHSTYRNLLVLDDEGLLKENRYFSLMGQPYAGRAVIRTEDEDQDMVDSDLDLDRVKERITWHPEGFKVEPMMQFVPLS